MAERYARAINCELTLADRVHQFASGEHIASGAKRLEAQHWSGHAFDRTMVLLNDVIEVFSMAYS
jgi:hypothetical protein